MPCSTFLAAAISFVNSSFCSGACGSTLSALSLKVTTAAFNVLTASSSWVCFVELFKASSADVIAALSVLNASSVFLPCSIFLAFSISIFKASFFNSVFSTSFKPARLSFNILFKVSILSLGWSNLFFQYLLASATASFNLLKESSVYFLSELPLFVISSALTIKSWKTSKIFRIRLFCFMDFKDLITLSMSSSFAFGSSTSLIASLYLSKYNLLPSSLYSPFSTSWYKESCSCNNFSSSGLFFASFTSAGLSLNSLIAFWSSFFAFSKSFLELILSIDSSAFFITPCNFLKASSVLSPCSIDLASLIKFVSSSLFKGSSFGRFVLSMTILASWAPFPGPPIKPSITSTQTLHQRNSDSSNRFLSIVKLNTCGNSFSFPSSPVSMNFFSIFVSTACPPDFGSWLFSK